MTLSSEVELNLNELPVLPAVVVRLMSLRADSRDYFEQVVSVTSEDPSLAARVLQAANSPVSAPVTPIDSLQTAVARLGAVQVGALVTSMAVTRVFVPTTEGQRQLWTHAVEVATASQLIADVVRIKRVTPEHAYLCGLLHDIGRFVMLEHHADEVDAVESLGWTTPADLVAAERAVARTDHMQVGWRVCKYWNLPADVAAVVRHHHDVEPSNKITPAQANVLEIVQVADLLSILMRSVPELAAEPTVLVGVIEQHYAAPKPRPLPILPDALERIVPSIVQKAHAATVRLGLTTP